MAFNPDQYIAEKTGSFNPDQYLAEKTQSPTTTPEISKGESFRRGATEMGTLGFAGELGGGVQALLQAITGGIKDQSGKPIPVSDVYKQARGEEEAAIKAAREANPKTFMAGGLVGSIPTLAGAGAVGLGGKGLAGALELGGVTGAITGAGEAENLSDIPRDVITGAATGAATGGALTGIGKVVKGAVSGGKSAIKSILDNPNVQNVLKSRQFGKQGELLIGKTPETETFSKLSKSAKDILENINKEVESSGIKIGEAKKITEQEILSPEELNIVKGKIQAARQKILSMLPEDIKMASAGERESAEKALKLLDDYSYRLENKAPQVVERIVESKPSTITKLQKEADRLTEQSKLSGDPSEYHVVETIGEDGNKYASLVKRTREISGETPEALVSVRGPNGEVLGEEFAQTGATPIKEGIKVKTLPSEPEIPQSKVFSPQAPETTQVPIEEMTRKKLYGLEGTARQYSTYGTEALPSEKVAGQMSNIVKDLSGVVPENVKAAQAPYKALGTTKDILGVTAKGTEADIAGEANKLTRLLASSEKEGLAPAQRSAMFDQIEELLRKHSPEVADKIKNARSLSEKYDLIQDLKKTSFLGKLVGAAIGGGVGGTVSGGIGAAGGAALGATVNPAMLANLEGMVEYKVKQALSNMSPQGYQAITNILSKSSQAGQYASKKLMESANKDQVARNATIFALDQNPEFRKIMKEKLGVSDDKNK